MFKKALIAAAVLAASTGLAFANGGTYQAPHHTHRAYIGIGASADSTSYDFHFPGFTSKNLVVPAGNLDLGHYGWNGELFAGFGWTFQEHYYLGGEIFGSISSNKTDLLTGRLKLKHSYGVSFIPGVMVTDATMLYGRVSWIRSRFELSVPGFNSHDSKNGLQLGVGVETLVAHNVSIRLEYDWARYSRFSTLNLKATVNQAKFDLIYNFMSA